MDLGFWKRALDPRNSMSSMAKPENCFELSLSNPRISDSNSNHLHLLQNGSANCNGNLFHAYHQNQFPHHHNQLQHPVLYQHQQQQQGLGQELGFLRPIRGIPVYQNPPPPIPFPFAQQPLDSSLASSPSSLTSNNTSNTSLSPFQSQGLMRSRFMPRFPAKRSMRAPRMRWTTTLHARFVHAVELLGGHESMLHFSFFLSLYSLFSLFPSSFTIASFDLSIFGNRKKKEGYYYAKEIILTYINYYVPLLHIYSLLLWGFRSYTQISS